MISPGYGSLDFYGGTASGGPAAPDEDPHRAVRAKLGSAAERGGFLAVTVKGARLPGAAQALASAHPVQRVDVNRAFLGELRALAEETGQGWERVLGVDAKFSDTGQISPGLAKHVRRVWDRVRERLAEQAATPYTVLFLHDAGLVARYFDEGGGELLVDLQNAARRPADAPHGPCLLCLVETPTQPPHLDGRTVDVIGDAERVTVDGTLLDNLRDGEGSAA